MTMLYYERQLAHEIAYMLPMFRDHSRNGVPKYNFRCPICGDSQKDQYKARGWMYESNGYMRFGCFNCGRNMSLYDYLKTYDEIRYREYLRERYKDESKPKRAPAVKQETKKVIESVQELPFCERMDLLPESHPAVKYLANRCLPKAAYKLFYFTREWKQLSNELNPGTYKFVEPEPRLVIPLFNEDHSISMIQGRAFGDVDKNQRYLTVKKDPDALKVFGLERIDPSKTVLYMEGPIDSVFIPNSLAIVGGSMSLADAPFKDKRVWVLDNEPRSKETVKRIETLIDAGERVVLWDECKWHKKDINDMIIKEQATPEEIHEYINNNIVRGLTAKRRLADWRRI